MTCSRVLVKDVDQRPGTCLKLITKALSKPLWHDANLVRDTISLLNTSDARWSESTTRKIDTVPQITASISRMPTSNRSLSKTLDKSYSFQVVIYSNLLNSTGKKLEREGSVIGYYSWWFRISLWNQQATS